MDMSYIKRPEEVTVMKKMTVEEHNLRQEQNMSEAEHQTRLFDELRVLALQNPIYDLPYHIPNGGFRFKKTAGQLKAMGVKAGIPDIHVPIGQVGRYGSLYIELKALSKGAKTTDKQNEMIEKLRACGNLVVVCRGWREALSEIKKYLGET